MHPCRPLLIPSSSMDHHPHHLPDSPANSSPRDASSPWDDHHHHHHPPPPLPPSQLRLMCSYGGHIIPRPHDRSLCYVGGDTRIVLVDRSSSLSQLHSRLSHTLLNGRPFTLKYQLPTEDLDSLISLATDEDLDNMIDEYDRTNSTTSPLKPSRLRLFLFPCMPQTAASMGSLLDDAKSETWFVDVLNGAGLLPRGLSDSVAIDNLLELDRAGMAMNTNSCTDLEPQQAQIESSSKQVACDNGGDEIAQDVVLDSPPLVETSSSFGSTSSSPSTANLPPIKVRAEDYQTAGLDHHEQFSNSSIAPNLANVAPPPVPSPFGIIPSSKPGGGENLNRVIYDDDQKSEKSDHGIVAPSAGLRKPPLPLQPVQRKFVDIHNLPSPDSKHAGVYNLPSPDSVASDCSITSAGSLSKNMVYQDAAAAAQLLNRDNRVPTGFDQKAFGNIITNQEAGSSQVQLVDSAHQYQQPPIFHPAPSNTHYIQQHPAVPMSSSYYPLYLQSNQQQVADPQYPMYLLPPLAQTQSAAACYDPPPLSNRPLTPPPPNNKAPYKDPLPPPLYTTKPPELAANLYPAVTGAAPLLVQVPTPQFQQQPYIGISHHQMTPQAAQSNAPPYGCDQCSHQMQQEQVYYGHQVGATAAPQYQTMTPAAAVMLSQASTHQLPPPQGNAAATAQQS